MDVPVEQAFEDIKTLVKEQNKWLYVDQNQVSAQDLSIEQLSNAKIITLTDMMIGG